MGRKIVLGFAVVNVPCAALNFGFFIWGSQWPGSLAAGAFNLAAAAYCMVVYRRLAA